MYCNWFIFILIYSFASNLTAEGLFLI